MASHILHLLARGAALERLASSWGSRGPRDWYGPVMQLSSPLRPLFGLSPMRRRAQTLAAAGVVLAAVTASACAPVRPALLPPAPIDSEPTLVEARDEVVAAHSACTEEYVTNQLPWQVWATSGAGAATVALVGGATAVGFLSQDPVVTGISVVGLGVLAVGASGATAYFAKDLRPRFERAALQKSVLAIGNDRANDAIARKDPLALRLLASELEEDCDAIEAGRSAKDSTVLLDELRTYRARVAAREVDGDRAKEQTLQERSDKEAAMR